MYLINCIIMQEKLWHSLTHKRIKRLLSEKKIKILECVRNLVKSC